jgi:hypothetical protein
MATSACAWAIWLYRVAQSERRFALHTDLMRKTVFRDSTRFGPAASSTRQRHQLPPLSSSFQSCFIPYFSNQLLLFFPIRLQFSLNPFYSLQSSFFALPS